MKNKYKLQLFPYLPNRPEWSILQKAFSAAKTLRPDVELTFVGHDNRYFYFQEYGNSEPILIPIQND